MPETVSINLRLPPELHERLKEWASRARRSLNSEIVHLLDEATNEELGRDL